MSDIFDKVVEDVTGRKLDIFDYAAEGQRFEARTTAQNSEIAAMTKTAVPYEPGFGATLAREFSGGISDIGEGVKSALTPSPVSSIGGGAAPGMLQAAGGVARAAFSPITALGSQLGETAGETVRSATMPYLGPTGSAIAGTMVGAPINAFTQLIAAPKAISAVVPYLAKATQAAARALPGAQVTLREIGKHIL